MGDVWSMCGALAIDFAKAMAQTRVSVELNSYRDATSMLE